MAVSERFSVVSGAANQLAEINVASGGFTVTSDLGPVTRVQSVCENHHLFPFHEDVTATVSGNEHPVTENWLSFLRFLSQVA